MYLRTYKRKNKDGSIAKYYQLAHNQRHPKTKQTTPQIIYNFGRADEVVHDQLTRLCKSISRACNLQSVELADGKEYANVEKLLSRIKTSEEKFKTIFENAQDEIVFLDLNGKVLEVNPAAESIFGIKREDVIGNYVHELRMLTQETIQQIPKVPRNVGGDNFEKTFEATGIHANGNIVFLEVTSKVIKVGDTARIIAVVRDISKRKLAEKKLQEYRDHLEELVKERTTNLEEANTALNVILKRKDALTLELEQKVVSNVNELILPDLEWLKSRIIDDGQKKRVELIEANLKDIISAFGHKLSSEDFNLTPSELRIANLIKYGKTTKEIAELLFLSSRTVEFHRSRIRKKIGIKNKVSNLRSFLLSLQ